MFFDPLYFVFALPGMLLGMWAQSKVKGTFNKFSQIQTSRGMTGAEIARTLLDAYGLQNVKVEHIAGQLTDHYDPRGKVLRLSDAVHSSRSVAAAGVAAHEMGHALQDAEGYAMLRLRSFMVPAVKVSGKIGPLMLMGGMMIGIPALAWLGVAIFAASALFALVTLPVEFDASSRAKKLLHAEGLLYEEEIAGVDKVLDAAAWTYVAAAIQAVMTIGYYIFRMQRGRRR